MSDYDTVTVVKNRYKAYHTCMAVRDTRGTAAAWSKEMLSGILATRLLLMVANSAYVPA